LLKDDHPKSYVILCEAEFLHTQKIIIMDILTSSKIKKMSPLLLVADVNRSLKFYTQKLGFELDFRYEDFYAGIIKDGYSIHLKMQEDKRENKELEIVFSVEGIEGLYEELTYKSVEFVQPLHNMPYGKEFYVADPDDNIIAFVEEAKR
jgi:catechol 2,3-dioxygenase-like lactoylglutathione lyase family enzyme